MPSATLDLQEYLRTLQECEAPLLGFVIFFNLSSKVERAMYEAAFAASGLDDKFLIKEIRPWMAARRAVNRWTTELKKTEQDGRAEILKDDPTLCKVALLTRDVDASGNEINYDQETLLFVHKDSGRLEIRNGGWGYDLFEQLYDEEKNWHNHSDLRRSILKIMGKANAHTLREHGGVYFVPQANVELIARLRILVNGLSESCHLYIIPVPESDAVRSEVKKTFGEDLKIDIVKFAGQIDALQEKKWKPATLKEKLKEFKTIKKKIISYEQLLNYTAEENRAALAALTDKVKAMLEEGPLTGGTAGTPEST